MSHTLLAGADSAARLWTRAGPAGPPDARGTGSPAAGAGSAVQAEGGTRAALVAARVGAVTVHEEPVAVCGGR
jgi:hypothetical protein